MTEGPSIARVAAAIGDPARAAMLCALLDGRALTASELAAVAGIGKQGASAHLARLVETGLLAVERQGRHRYHRLAGADVAELIERLMGVAERAGARPLVSGPRDPALRHARVCYDHLAGELAVRIADRWLARRWLVRSDDGLEGSSELSITRAGGHALDGLGFDVDALRRQRRAACRACLDWSARRHHLAGALGAALLARCLERRWATRVAGSRTMRFTPAGERSLLRELCGEG